MSEWQLIKTAPRNETYILLRDPSAESGCVIGFWSEGDQDWFESEASSNPIFNSPTYWCPLPNRFVKDEQE